MEDKELLLRSEPVAEPKLFALTDADKSELSVENFIENDKQLSKRCMAVSYTHLEGWSV